MAYHVILRQFEGPLDLLLHLVTQARIDIREIFVSSIVEQYLSYVSQFSQQDMDRASEFMLMAARLVEIKSRHLLPRPPSQEDELDADEELLFQQLEEYRRIKQSVEGLQMRYESAADLYSRLPEEWGQEETFQVKDTSLTALMEAFLRLQERLTLPKETPEAPADTLTRENYTVQRQSLYIRGLLRGGKKLAFHQLFQGAASRQEVVVTFMALLELIHDNEVEAVQATAESEIILQRMNPGEVRHG